MLVAAYHTTTYTRNSRIDHEAEEEVMRTTELISVRAFARRKGWTLKYVYDLLYSGRLPGRKIGRRWVIPAEALKPRGRVKKNANA